MEVQIFIHGWSWIHRLRWVVFLFFFFLSDFSELVSDLGAEE